MNSSISFKINRNNNPVYLGALGVAPLVAMSKSLSSGFLLGSVFVVDLVITALVISSLRSFLPHTTRLAYLLVVSAAWVTVTGLLTQVMVSQLHLPVQSYLAMIAMNCLVLFFLEVESLKQPPRYIIKPLCHISGLIFMICLLVGSIREILSSGGLFLVMENTTTVSGMSMDLLPATIIMPIFNTAAGAFIITGCVFALINILLDLTSTD